MTTYPVINLPGSDSWTSGYELGLELDQKFPGQDGEELGTAMACNTYPPVEGEIAFTSLRMLQRGERDGKNWLWEVGVNGETWYAHGGCDYTGWDCRSSLDWSRENPLSEERSADLAKFTTSELQAEIDRRSQA